MDDRMIIDLYLARDESAISETASAYGSALQRLSERILMNHEDAEEVTNDTYLSCWKLIPPNKPYEYFRQFLMKIARHLSFDRLRASGAEKRSAEFTELTKEMEECLPGKTYAESHMEEEFLKEILNSWLQTLSADRRAFFVRRYFFAESIREIAEKTGASESRVKVSLYRARAALKEVLEKEGYQI